MPVLLVVDDIADNRTIMSHLFRHYDYNVIEAENGAVALSLAQAHAPNLILMDLNMPVMTGWEAVALLRAHPLTATIPVVAVTAGDYNKEALRAAGFSAALRKPVMPRKLLEVVRSMLAEPGGDACRGDIPFGEGRNSLDRSCPGHDGD